jgi:hypothetical protein
VEFDVSEITVVVTSSTLSVALSGVLVWIFRTWIGEQLRNAIKNEYDQKLESHKAQLKADFDKEVEILKARLKAESDKELESLRAKLNSDVAIEHLRSRLQIASSEHEIRFERLHETQARIIAKTYGLLEKVTAAVASYTAEFEYSNDPPKSEKRKSVAQTMTAFQAFYKPRRLFFPEATAEKIDAFDKKLYKLARDFMFGVEQGGDSRREGASSWTEVSIEMRTNVPKLFETLRQDFQAILGVRPLSSQESNTPTK